LKSPQDNAINAPKPSSLFMNLQNWFLKLKTKGAKNAKSDKELQHQKETEQPKENEQPKVTKVLEEPSQITAENFRASKGIWRKNCVWQGYSAVPPYFPHILKVLSATSATELKETYKPPSVRQRGLLTRVRWLRWII
jgi:hypothetical protein